MSETRPSGGALVLVVDDDAALAEMLQIVLHQEGFETAWCSRGDEAFAAFQHSRPDLVLLDLMLPGRDGVDVCRDIRAISREATVRARRRHAPAHPAAIACTMTPARGFP